MVNKYMYDKYLKIEEVKEELKKKYRMHHEEGDFCTKEHKRDDFFYSYGLCNSHYAECISMIYEDLFHEKIESEDE